MIIHNFDPVLVDFGFLEIRWYSLAYIFGVIGGWIYSIKIIKHITYNDFNFKSIKPKDFDDLIIYIVIGIIIGGRLGYIFFYNLTYYTQNPLEIIKVWEGGMSFHGGVTGVIVSIIIFSYNTKTNFFKLSDIVSCAAPIGIFFGRIANFINGELYGKVSNVPWAVIFPNIGDLARHPSQIYEALLEGVFLFVLINYLAFKKKLIFKSGYISCLFIIFYSILRIFSEFFREPDLHLGHFFNFLSMGSLLSIIFLFLAFLTLLFLKGNGKNN